MPVSSPSDAPCLTSPTSCTLLIFDLDGTLIDSFSDIRRSLLIAFESVNIPWSEEYAPLIKQGVGLQAFYDKALGKKSKSNPEHLASFITAYRNDYNQNSRNTPYPFAESLLTRLRKERPAMKLAIATTKPTTMAKSVLQHCGLAHYFDVICGTDNLPHKPNPALLHHVCRLTNSSTSQAMMVGDTDRDIGAAQAAPMTSIAICHGGWSKAELLALNPSFLVDNLHDLHGLLSQTSAEPQSITLPP